MPSSPSFQQRRHPLGSLATKIILFVFLSTFATALVVSWVSIHSTHRSLRGVIDRLYPHSLEHAQRRLSPWLESAHTELTTLAMSPELAGKDDRATARLRESLAESEHWVALAQIGPDGKLQRQVGVAGIDLVAFARAMQTSWVMAGDGATRPAIWRPLPGGGAVVGLLDPVQLERILSAFLPDAQGMLALVGRGGRVLAETGAGSQKTAMIPVAALTAPAGHAHEYDSGGRRVIGATLTLPHEGWSLVLETPFDIAFAPVLEVVSRIFVIDLVVILLFSFLAYRVTGAVVRPIERLSDWARRIAQGQLDLEIPETGGRDEIGLLARTFNDMMRQLRRNQHEIETTNRDLTDRNVRLQQANEVLNQLSITDGLTKLHNHRFFQDHLTRELKRVSRTREALSMLLIDIDDFKQLNDRFGHAAGDELLMRMAPLLNTAVRENDLVARYGGEEFVILVPNTNAEGAYQLAEKVRTAIAESSFILDDSLRPIRVTVSIGVAQFSGNRKRFFQRTDEALYRAKADGKNCVVVDVEDESDSPLA